MEFRILGPLEVSSDGQALDLGGAKQRALLAVLLLDANNVVSTDRLIDALWEDDPPESAQKALQVHVSGLRKLVGKERLQTKAPGYLLQLEDGELDLDRFRELQERGRPAEALSVWRGPPLADCAHLRFAQPEIARLEDLRLACVEERIEQDLQARRHTELTGELEALVAEHPLRERLRGQLMLALYRSGRQADALDAYQAARRALVDELGIEPSHELRELHQRILNQDAGLDLGRPRATEAGSEAGAAFVGREPELAELTAGLDDAFGGRGRLFLLQGEPGIGKSRLADELLSRARARGAHALVGRCWEAGGAPAYWPWTQALRTYMRASEPSALRRQLGTSVADVARIVPQLRELFPGLPEPEPSESEAEAARFRLFDSTATFLKNSSVERPLVLAFDDLHAADEPSLLLLRYVATALEDSRIVIVGTFRDLDPTVQDPLESTVAELGRASVTRRIRLSGLSRQDVARLAESTAGTAPSDRLVAELHEETEGNPLFVSEIVRLLAAEDRLGREEPGRIPIPETVREAIGRRLRHLSGECRRVLSLASVLGREFGLVALERVAEYPGIDKLLGVLDEAIIARVVEEIPGAAGRLRFGHALTRDALYEKIPGTHRARLHRHVAEVLEALYAGTPGPHLAELAHHFSRAVPAAPPEKAVEYATRAGDQAARLVAYEEATRLYALALQALELEQPIEPGRRCELLLALGDTLGKAGRTTEAKQTFLAAAEIARAARLQAQLARAAIGYGGRFPWQRAGRDERLVPLLQEALTALGQEESVSRVRVLARLAGALRDEPSLEPRSSLSRQAVEIARTLGDPETLGYALTSLYTSIWGPDPEELVPIADEVSRLAEETGDHERALQARWLQHIAHMTLGDTTRVATLAYEYQRFADELRQPSQQWYGTVMRSVWELLRGEFSEAERHIEEAVQLGERAQSWDSGFSYRVATFVLRREQGRLAEIEDLIRGSVDEYPGYREFRCLVVLLDHELGREGEAQRALDELATDDFAAFPRDSEWLFCLCILSEVAASLRDGDRAATLYRLLDPFGQLSALAAGEVSLGPVARYLGLLAVTMRRWDEAMCHFDDALAMNERMGARPWHAHAQADYARMLLARAARGDAERARTLLDQAGATYRELGMDAYAARASALGGEAAVSTS
jgi:DNA-binding SARP family transcriptional activator/tetratricopeptide (TPR) repeat protein